MTISKQALMFIIIIMAGMLISLNAHARHQINVAGYIFPPFLNKDLTSGLTPELIELLNSSQEKYNFVLVPTSPKRRYASVKNDNIDMMFFEMEAWGWQGLNIPIQTTREIMTGREVYIALKKDGRDQSFFEEIDTKKISAFFGYHYGFAGFNADVNWLEENYNIVLNHSHERNLDLIMRGVVDIAIVTKSYIDKFFKENPKKRERFMISEKLDQVYSLPILVSQNSTVSVEVMEQLLDQLKASGKLQSLFKEVGLESALVY